MLLGRPIRNALCQFLAVALLCTQIAVSAFACPGPQAMAAMADCPDRAADASKPDVGPSALCAGHCQQGQQNDQVHAPELPAVVLTRLYTRPEPIDPALPTEQAVAPHSAFAAASPPHAILHCCFRI